MTKTNNKFLDQFPGHVYRYIDQTGEGRPAISSSIRKNDLNVNGYESYFTVNGFEGSPDAKKENCTSINAFFVDIDGRKDMEEIETIKKRLDPTFILETQNGHHIYWLLDEPIYKDETPDWDAKVFKWEGIEQSIVTTLKSDPVVKDITRILRVPDTFYWKKSGDKYHKGTDGVFKIKGIYKQLANTYSMDTVSEAFPPVAITTTAPTASTYNSEKLEKYAEAEKKDFFKRVNEKFPIEQRESFKKLISGEVGTLPPNIPSRNQALLVTATLMRQANWSITRAVSQIQEVGWHGIEKERGGQREIETTIKSAYASGYTYSYKNEIIAWNMSHEEQIAMQTAYTAVGKDKRETDKVRFTNYEREILSKHPYLKKNEIGIIFNYDNGVYRMMSDQEISNLILESLYEDMLWNYRTQRNVSDKVACLISIIPDLEITDDKGYIANVKNGLLNIETRALAPHTPDFISLIQYPVEYDPAAACPNFNQCLEDWVMGEEAEEKKKLLQQFSGYCLSSSMLYDKALFLVGDGGNGKSTFSSTIAMVIGPDATSHIDLEGLYGQYGLKGLIGKRLNLVEEVQGNYYQSNKLKKLISGEKVTIDIKYKDQFDFKPQAKFMFSVNRIPRVDDTSTATERRMCVVAFNGDFKKNPNRTLRSDMGLKRELSGILNWMLDGADLLRNEGKFIITKEQLSMLSEYRQENSSVEGFIEECLVSEFGVNTSAREVYEEYKEYCIKDGRKFKGNIEFTKEVKAYGVRYGKFGFIERQSSRQQAMFKDVKLDRTWSGNALGGGSINAFDL
jgi:P4 family phage/plasmid primase-like protien